MLEHRLLISGNTLSSCFQWFTPYPPSPCSPLSALPTLVWANQAWKHKMDLPYSYWAPGCGMNRGWATMFRCFNAANLPSGSPIPHYYFKTHSTHTSLLHCKNSRLNPHSRECNRQPGRRIPQILSENFFLPSLGWIGNVPPAPELQIKQISV